MGRVVGREEAASLREAARARGETVVFTNGVFDLLHRGHVDLLRAARDLGDLLVVGVNSDASVTRLKGPGRPVNGLEDRAVVLAALASVDLVVAFEEDTPLELIRSLVPDILVKGADYRPEDVVGAEVVAAAGGRVERVALTPGRSTSGILDRVQRRDTD